MTDPRKEVLIDYTNWMGERSTRRIRPIYISFENSEWHPDTQWVLYAIDLEKNAERVFALKDVHSWKVSLG